MVEKKDVEGMTLKVVIKLLKYFKWEVMVTWAKAIALAKRMEDWNIRLELQIEESSAHWL